MLRSIHNSTQQSISRASSRIVIQMQTRGFAFKRIQTLFSAWEETLVVHRKFLEEKRFLLVGSMEGVMEVTRTMLRLWTALSCLNAETQVEDVDGS